jgi:hypothetical protein
MWTNSSRNGLLKPTAGAITGLPGSLFRPPPRLSFGLMSSESGRYVNRDFTRNVPYEGAFTSKLARRSPSMPWIRSVLFTLFALPVDSASVSAAENDNRIPDDLRATLEKADQFELLSLSPDRPQEKPKDAFHGWKILGKTTVKDAETRKKLIAAFKKGVEDNKGTAAACFNPRHGIRVTQDGKTADFVICFECFRVQVFVGDKSEKGFLITDSPTGAFDGVLKEAKVPLAEKPKK